MIFCRSKSKPFNFLLFNSSQSNVSCNMPALRSVLARSFNAGLKGSDLYFWVLRIKNVRVLYNNFPPAEGRHAKPDGDYSSLLARWLVETKTSMPHFTTTPPFGHPSGGGELGQSAAVNCRISPQNSQARYAPLVPKLPQFLCRMRAGLRARRVRSGSGTRAARIRE